jgi:hypothetical protein
MGLAIIRGKLTYHRFSEAGWYRGMEQNCSLFFLSIPGSARGKVLYMAPDFDAALEGVREYMQ